MVDFQNDPEILELGADASDLVSAAEQVDVLAAAIERLSAAVGSDQPAPSGLIDQAGALISLANAFEALDEVRKSVGPDLEKFLTAFGKTELSAKTFESELSRITAAIDAYEQKIKELSKDATAVDNSKLQKSIEERLNALRAFRDSARKVMYEGDPGVSPREFLDAVIGPDRGGAPIRDLQKIISERLLGTDSNRYIQDAVEQAALQAQIEIQQAIRSAGSRVRGASDVLSRQPSQVRQSISYAAAQRRAEQERKRIAEMENRASDASSDVRRDPEVIDRVFKTPTADESEAIKTIRNREGRLARLSTATRNANDEAQRLAEEQAKLRRSLAIAKHNEGAISEDEAAAEEKRDVKNNETSTVIRKIRIPGPGPEEIEKIKKELERNALALAAARKTQASYARELTDFLVEDPLRGLKLPRAVDPAALKKIIADKLVAIEIERFTKENKAEPSQSYVEDFRKYVSQEGTGAAARLATELISERRSESPLFDRAMAERESKKKTRRSSVASTTRQPSGLDAEGVYIENDLKTTVEARDAANARIAELTRKAEAATLRLRATQAAAMEVLGEDELTLRAEERVFRPGGAQQAEVDLENLSERQAAALGRSPESRPNAEEESRLAKEAGKHIRTRKPLGGASSANKEQYEAMIAKLMQELVPSFDSEYGYRQITRDEAIAMIADEFDAAAEDIKAIVGEGPQTSELGDEAFVEAISKELVKTAKNKVYRDTGKGITGPEVKSLQAAIRRALKSLQSGGSISEKDSDILTANLIAQEVIDAFESGGAGSNLSSDNRNLAGGPPGSRQTATALDVAAEKAAILGRADAESSKTGRSTDDIIRSQLNDAEERARETADDLDAAQAELRRLEAIINSPDVGRSRFFDLLGITDRRMGGVDPEDVIYGRSPSASSARRTRLKTLSARIPGGFAGVGGGTLATKIGGFYGEMTGENDRQRMRAEPIEGTVGWSGLPENPVSSLFYTRKVNTGGEGGTQLNVSQITPAEAGPAIEFMKELFQSIQILTAEMAETLADGKTVRPKDIDDLAANLGLLKVAYDQIRELKSSNPEAAKALQATVSSLEDLAKDPAIQRLFSPEFIGAGSGTIRGTGSIGAEEKLSLAQELIQIFHSITAGGQSVVGGMESFGAVSTKSPAGSGSARIKGTGEAAPESAQLSASAIKTIAGQILISGKEGSKAAIEDLKTLVSELIARGDLIPADLINLIDDPALAEEIRKVAERNVPTYALSTTKTPLARTISAELYGTPTTVDEETGQITPGKDSQYKRQFQPGFAGKIRLPSEIEEQIRQRVNEFLRSSNPDEKSGSVFQDSLVRQVRAGSDITIDQLRALADDRMVSGYAVEGGRRVAGNPRTVADSVGPEQIKTLVEKILNIENVIEKLATDINVLFSEEERGQSGHSDKESADAEDARNAEASLARTKIEIAEMAIRIAALKRSSSSAVTPWSTYDHESHGTVDADVAREVDSTKMSDVNLAMSNMGAILSPFASQEQVDAETRDVASFKRIDTVEQLDEMGPSARAALAFGSLPISLVTQLIEENPKLASLATPQNPITTLDSKTAAYPKGGVLEVSREAAVAVLEALRKAGVRISFGKFAPDDYGSQGPAAEQLVSVTHLGEELSDDQVAAQVAGVVAQEIQFGGIASNALTAITTPQFISYPESDRGRSSRGGVGGAIRSVGAYANVAGATPEGVIRTIQVPRARIPARAGLRPMPMGSYRETAAHEFSHTVTVPAREESRQSLVASINATLERLGVDGDQIRSLLGEYGETAPFEMLAEAYRILRGYVRNEEEEQVTKEEPWAESFIPMMLSLVDRARSVSETAGQKRRASSTSAVSSPSSIPSMPESAAERLDAGKPGYGSAPAGVANEMYGDTIKSGASFRLGMSGEGSPILTENTPQTGFMVGGMGKKYLNLKASEIEELPIPGGATEEEIAAIKQENERRKAKFRAAVAKIIAENSEELKKLLEEGKEVYIGSWVEQGKVAVDVTERIPYIEGDERGRTTALRRGLKRGRDRQQQSLAEIATAPGEGRGTGAGYGAVAFPRTGIKNPDAMKTTRTWISDEVGWSEEPDQPEAPKPMASEPPNLDEMEQQLIAHIKKDPSSEQAQKNYVEFLQIKGIRAEQIARLLDAAKRGGKAAEQQANTEVAKADVAEEAATQAEDDLGLFEDFTDEEMNEEYYGDDESGTYEVLPEEKKAQGERKDAAAEKIIAAGEQEVQALEESASAAEEKAVSTQESADEEIAQSDQKETEQTATASVGRLEEIDAELSAIFAKKQELQAKLQEVLTEQGLIAASLQQKIERALEVLDQVRLDRLADELVSIELDTDKEMKQREARFRRTEKGQKVNKKTGEYVHEFVPEVYGPESPEYKQLMTAGLTPDKDNAFTDRDVVFEKKSRQLRYELSRYTNLGSEVGLDSISGGDAQPTTLEDVRAYAGDRQRGRVDEVPTKEIDDAKAAIQEFNSATEPTTRIIRNLTDEINSLKEEEIRLIANKAGVRESAPSANEIASQNDKNTILQKQIIPEQLAPIIELLKKTILIADQKLQARGIDTSGLTAKEKASALGDVDVTGRKLEYLIRVIEAASRARADSSGKGGVFLPNTVLPADVTGKTPDAKLKSASRITGMLPGEISAISGVVERINAALLSLEAQAASGEVDLEALAASLQNVSSEASQTASSLLDTTTAEQERAAAAEAAAGGGAAGGGGDGTTTGGPTGPMDDPNNDWRNIRATIPDTENISRGVSDLAALQNRFAELGPVISHTTNANQQFGKSLDYSAAKAQQASATLQRLTDTNVGLLRSVKTQVGRAATFLVLQQLGREIGGIVEHLQSGVFKFNQVLENTQVGFNTLFANTLQANAAVGNELVPKLNEAGRQIGFMREQSVKFSDALNYTAGAATNMVAEIRNIANVTPFRFQPLVEASLKMKAFGFEAAEIPGMINSISNAVAALGGEDEKIDRIAYALGQMNSAGRVYQNDMMQLANAGIAGYRMLSEKLLMDLTAMKNRSLGVMKDLPEETAKEFDRLQSMLNSSSFKKSFGSIDEMISTLQDPKRAEGLIRNLAKRGFLIGATAARAITEGMDRQYQGSADRLSRTMTGALSTIADLSQNFMATAFQPVFNSVRDTIVQVGQFMLKSREIIKFVDGVRDRMQSFIASLASFGPALQAAGQIFIDVFVSGLGSALDKGQAFGSVISGIIGNLGPGLRLIGNILTNDVGKGLVVATLAFSLFSKAITANPMIAAITVLIAAISGIAAAIENNTLGVGTFVKMFLPSIEQLLRVIGEGIGTILSALSGGAMTGFIGGLSAALNVLMPLLTMFLTTMSVILKIITPLAGPLGFVVGLFIALKTAMMAFDLAGTVVGKVMNGIHDAWGKVNGAIDAQINKVKQTAAAYDELSKAKRAAEDFKRNDRGEMLDEKGNVTKDKSKAALLWGEGERVASYGMSERKGRAAQLLLEGRGYVPGLKAVDRARQSATDEMQNLLRPDFGEGFYLEHEDKVLGHTVPVISNKSIEGTYDYLNLAEVKKQEFEKQNKDAIASGSLTEEQSAQYQDLKEAAALRRQASTSGMFRFAGLDRGKEDKEGINVNAGAYSMDNLTSAILVQKETSWILNKTFAQLEEAGKKIVAMKEQVEKIKKQMESGEITPEQGEKKISELNASMDNIRRGQSDNMSILGGLAEAGVPVMGEDGQIDPSQVKNLTVDDFGKRGINIPPGVAAGIKKMPAKIQNIILSKVMERYANGEVFLTKQEEEQFFATLLGDARGKQALKGGSIGVLKKASNAMSNVFKKTQEKLPAFMKRIERGGGNTGLSEIDSRGGQYYYVDEETGMLSDRRVDEAELKKRTRMRGFGMEKLGKVTSLLGSASVAAGLASGASRLAGQVAPILSAPIIGPLVDLLPKEMTNYLRQKAGPFQAMAQGIGTTLGSVVGQALIPIPGVGAAIGGLIGGALAELIGAAIDGAIAGSESAIRQKKALMEEAKVLGFTDAQAKAIADEKVLGGGIPGITQDPTDESPLDALFNSYKVGEQVTSLGKMSDEEFNKRILDIRTNLPEDQRAEAEDRLRHERDQREKGIMSQGEYESRKNAINSAPRLTPQTKADLLAKLEKERTDRSASNAFDVKQAEFMKSGMDYETIKRYVGEEDILARKNLEILKEKNKVELALIEGKLARGEDLSDTEKALNEQLKQLTAAAAASPIGLFGTLIDPKLFSPTQMMKAFDTAGYGRTKYTQADVDAGVKDKNGAPVVAGAIREGFTEFETLLKNKDIMALTQGAGFSNAADALNALGFDYSKISKDTTDQEFMQLVKETLRIGVQARSRGDELMPKVDLALTRLQMMERYGGEAGYKMFDQYAGDREKYQAAESRYKKLGGDARLALLEEIQSQSLPTRYIEQGKGGLGRDQYGGKDTATSVKYGPENLLTFAEEEELKKLKAAQKDVTDARYKDLEVKMKIRMSTMGATSTEVAQGVAAEKAYSDFRIKNQEKLAAAYAAGTKATKEQLALLAEDVSMREKAYKTENVKLQVGDALQAAEAAGLQISDKELANNVALQKILLLKQRVIEANGGAALSMIASKVAEAQVEQVIADIMVKKVKLGDIELQQADAKAAYEIALANYKKEQNATTEAALNNALRRQNALRNQFNVVQKEIDDLMKKAAQFEEDAAKANPFKLTKKEVDEIKKLIAKDPGSILGGDGGSKDTKTLQKNIDLLNKMANIAQKTYDRMRKEQQRTHDEYIKQLDEQEKRINERYKQRSDQQTEENLQAQLQIAGLQMRSESADPLEAAKAFYDAKQALEQFYIDQQRDAELKVISDEKERYNEQFNKSSEASQAIYDAALQRLNSRFEFAQQVLSGDEKMAGKMNDALRLTMFGGNEGTTERSSAANTAFNAYKGEAISVALQKQYGVTNIAGLYKKYSSIDAGKRTAGQKAVINKYNSLLAAARKETAQNAMLDAISGLSGQQDITMTTSAEQDLATFESQNRDAIAAALAANENITSDQEELLAQLSEMRSLAEEAKKDALLGALGTIQAGTLYNDAGTFEAKGGGFAGGITGLTYGGEAVNSSALAEKFLKVYRGTTEESGLSATFMNEAIMKQLRYKDQNGKEYAGAGDILAYLTEVVNNQGGGALGISKLNPEQGALYKYLMTLVSSKNTFTTAQKTAILAQRTLEQGLNDFEQATGVDINIANLAEADITDKQFTDYFNALGKTFEDNAARDAAIQKMRDVLRDTYGQALLSVDVEQYAKFADSNDVRIGKLSNVADSLKDVMQQIGNVMSAENASKMTSLDKLLFGANFDPNNLSGAGNPISNIQFGKTQIDAVSAAVVATRDAFESSMNSIKAYAQELGGPLGAFHQQTIADANTVGVAMTAAASSFSLATEQVNMYAEALAKAAAAKNALGIDQNFAAGIGTSGATGNATPAANNTYNITVNNAEGMDAQQLAAELARLIAQQAGSTVN